MQTKFMFVFHNEPRGSILYRRSKVNNVIRIHRRVAFDVIHFTYDLYLSQNVQVLREVSTLPSRNSRMTYHLTYAKI